MNVLAGIFLVLVTLVALAAVAAWPVMLLWGAIAGTYGLPTMGFGTAVQVSILAHLLFGGSSSSSKS